MRSQAALLALVASTTCAEVTLVWQHAKASSHTSLRVLDGDENVIAQSCSSYIADSSNSIDFSDVDENGSGNFTLGTLRYQVHSDPAYSGGPTCGNIYNDRATVVECTGLSWSPSGDVEIQQDCLDDEDGKLAWNFKRSLTTPSLKKGHNHDARHVSTLAQPKKRETPPSLRGRQDCQFKTHTGLVGDGDPHQNFLHKQVTENHACGDGTCGVGESEIHSYSIGWTATLSPVAWISGGFSVTESWSTGKSYTCNANAGETVCVWYNTAHTAYTVQNSELNTCENQWIPTTDPYVMWSPNENNRGGEFYCVRGSACRTLGDQYWDYSGRAGGP